MTRHPASTSGCTGWPGGDFEISDLSFDGSVEVEADGARGGRIPLGVTALLFVQRFTETSIVNLRLGLARRNAALPLYAWFSYLIMKYRQGPGIL